MSHGPISVFTKTITVGGSLTASYDLGRAWPSVYLVVPTMAAYITTATCNIYVKASADNSTFFDVVFPPANSATTGVVTFTLANTISQCVVPIPNALQYLKVQVANNATAAVAFNIICSGD
jgi:hypothetical protein